MGKNIAFFADGTWSGPEQDNNNDGVPDPTNVFQLFDHLEGEDSPDTKLLQNEQEQVARDRNGALTQLSKYVHGVGDSRNIIHKVIGGGFGAGTINRIVRGYTFISRHYASGDRIYIAGFSRGAYTARALAGMICSQGLLNAQRFGGLEDRERAYRLGITVWTRYREAAGRSGSYLDFLKFRSDARVTDADLLPGVEIEAVGVWDTVGSLGIPAYTAGEGRNDFFQFADCRLNPRVHKGYHAVSIDERRADFVPTLWEPAANVVEVWFAGAHSDVGGGRPGRDLSDIALQWMAERLRDSGLLIGDALTAALNPNPAADIQRPWDDDPWRFLPFKDRSVPASAQVHASVSDRRTKRSDYTPAALSGYVFRA